MNLETSAQVVHLVRDPRAVLSSREVAHWDKGALEAGRLCKDMLRDLDISESLPPERCDTTLIILEIELESFPQVHIGKI